MSRDKKKAPTPNAAKKQSSYQSEKGGSDTKTETLTKKKGK